MKESLRHFICDEAWMGLTGLETTGLVIAMLALAFVLLSSIDNLPELWNAS